MTPRCTYGTNLMYDALLVEPLGSGDRSLHSVPMVPGQGHCNLTLDYPLDLTLITTNNDWLLSAVELKRNILDRCFKIFISPCPDNGFSLMTPRCTYDTNLKNKPSLVEPW